MTYFLVLTMMHSGGDFIVQRGITLLINIFCRVASSYTVQHLFSLI